jgi:hypothetical protein
MIQRRPAAGSERSATRRRSVIKAALSCSIAVAHSCDSPLYWEDAKPDTVALDCISIR